MKTLKIVSVSYKNHKESTKVDTMRRTFGKPSKKALSEYIFYFYFYENLIIHSYNEIF